MSFRQANFPVIRDSQGEQTNPTTATVMADSGALSEVVGGGGIYEALVIVSTTVNAEFVVQRRNTANDGNVGDVHVFYASANNTVSVPFRFEVERNERIRVMMNANLTGDAVANVIVQRVA